MYEISGLVKLFNYKRSYCFTNDVVTFEPYIISGIVYILTTLMTSSFFVIYLLKKKKAIDFKLKRKTNMIL